MLIDDLKNTKNLSDNEKEIAHYILENPKKVIEMTISDFSATVFSSNSTVVRFCQKLGFKGFSDFKITLAKEISMILLQNERIEVDMPILPTDSDEAIVKAFVNLNSQAIEDAYHNLNIKDLRQAVNLLEDSHRITLWGIGNSALVALDFHNKLKHIGYPSSCDNTMGFHNYFPSRFKNHKEVAVIFSTYANSKQVRDWITQFKEAKCKVILISANPNTPYANLVDCSVLIDNSEKRMVKMGVFASRIAMQFVADIIYAMLFQLDYQNNVLRQYKSGQQINEQGEYLKNILLGE